MNFSVGQKVVCVDASMTEHGNVVLLRKGAIYTVREVLVSTGGLHLQEVECIPHAQHTDWFRKSRFRPAVERKTDISIFTKILNDVKATEPVR